jgi:hypothetical protein
MYRDSHVAQRIVYDLELVVDDHRRPSLRIECGPKRDHWVVRVSRAGEGHPGFAHCASQRLRRARYWTHDWFGSRQIIKYIVNIEGVRRSQLAAPRRRMVRKIVHVNRRSTLNCFAFSHRFEDIAEFHLAHDELIKIGSVFSRIRTPTYFDELVYICI